ncbi:MAG: pyrimidine/purine nucleoside phosphorylase [Halioglobus sp.]
MLTVNEYFEGNVKSIAFDGGDLPASVGVMAPGEYTFGTSQREYMTVISGELIVKLPKTEQWNSYLSGETFIVEANQSFDLKVPGETAYLCKYE